MPRRIIKAFGLLTMVFFFLFRPALSAENGTIQGSVTDAQTGEALPGANLLLQGTSLGAASDLNGNFIVRNVPAGSYKLRATYVGYNQKEIDVIVQPGATVKLDIKLDAVGIKGKEVVITAQASGQNSAINQQLSSMRITNVVSAARIQELPDANAAESVGRLPGVSLIREGGEGSQVVIRGLSPQYNQITIDGVEMASDVASSNNIVSTDASQQDATQSLMGDRGVDLSMISSNTLGGIEVIKAITPDMDAAVLGGVVNFDLRKATASTHDLLPNVSLVAQGAYNQLKNTRNDYLFYAQAENRYFNNSFGIILSGSAQRRNLSDNELGTSYQLFDKSHGTAGIPELTSLTLTDGYRIRDRYNGTLVMDYEEGATRIGLMNIVSSGDTKTTLRSETAYILAGLRQMNYGLEGQDTKLDVMTNLLSVNTSIPFFRVDLRLSHSYSQTNDPQDAVFNFVQDHGGFDGGIGPSVAKLPPQTIATYIQPNDSVAWLDNINNFSETTKERIVQGKIDLEHDFDISNLLTAKLKFGGMYQYRTRSYNYFERTGSLIYDGGGAVVTDFTSKYPNLAFYNGSLSMTDFAYNGYSFGDFLNGQYTIPYALNDGLMWDLIPIANNSNHSTVYQGGYKTNNLGSTINNYSGNEKRSAAYAMLTFNIGDQLTILPGARYQNLTTDYTAPRLIADPTVIGFHHPDVQSGNDTTITKAHGYLLPMVHLIYKPFNWLQVHFAYTNTINYPDYGSITPRYYLGSNFITYNNTNLKPATSQNFDLVVSLYSNEIGLLSVDGFTKRISDLIFYSHGYANYSNLSQFPDVQRYANSNVVYDFTTYINSPIPVNLNGIEADWQTHFWYLPGPLSGLILGVNYTHIFSKASYPRDTLQVIYNEDGTSTKTPVSAPYADRLLNQPDDIVNLDVGYDYRGFSIRISMIYQNNVFKQPDFWLQQRTISAAFTRWDLSVKQDLPWYGLQVYLNLINLNSANQVDINEKTTYPAAETRYGSEAELGLRMKL